MEEGAGGARRRSAELQPAPEKKARRAAGPKKSEGGEGERRRLVELPRCNGIAWANCFLSKN